MKNYQSLAISSVLTSALLMGCDGELDLSHANDQQNSDTNSMSVRIPKSLQANDSSNDPADTNTQSAAKKTVENVGAVASTLNQSVAGAPNEALQIGAELLTDRVEFAQEVLNDIDSAWNDITNYCVAIPQGTKCEIPAGTLTFAEGAQQEDALTYLKNPSDKYQHSITRNATSGTTESEQIQWNTDRSLIAMSFVSEWQDEQGNGTQSSDLLFSENDNGDQVSLRDEFTLGDSTFTDYQQLHELNDGLNGIELITEFNWADAYSSGQWQSQAVANDDGGKLGTSASFDNEELVWHTKETFDKNGDLASSEHCEQTQGIDCGDTANWTDAEISGSDFTIDIDIEGSDEALEIAYQQACNDLDIPDSECGFSESAMIVLNGAQEIYDNTDDVQFYLCIEHGTDELDCSELDTETSVNSIDTDGSLFGEVATEADSDPECTDCEQDNNSNSNVTEAFEIDELESTFNLIDLDQHDLLELENIDTITLDAIACDSDADDSSDCEFEFEIDSTEVTDAVPTSDDLEDYKCIEQQDSKNSDIVLAACIIEDTGETQSGE